TMKMKKIQALTIVFAFICAIGLAFTAAPLLADDTTVIRWAHPSPKKGFEPGHFEWWEKEIEERTNGRVKIEVYWGGALANFKEMAEATEAGMADVGWITSSYHPGYMEMLRVAHAAYLMNNEPDPVKYMEKWELFLEKLPEFYNWEAEKNNMIPISPVYYDEYWIFSKKPIRNIDDLKGVKIRAISEPRQIAFKAVGASPTFIGAGEMYSALDKGIIDAVCYSPDTAKRYNIHEVTSYVTPIGLQPGVAYWAMNYDTFSKLSWLDQKIILDMGRKAAMDKAAWMKEERARALETFKKEGMEVVDFDEADLEKLGNVPEFKEFGKKWVVDGEDKGMAARKAMDLYCEIFGVESPLED
ncbi:MAG: TRAP transporter substrate-binding protein DctP, partial [Desulfobacterales bacterium]